MDDATIVEFSGRDTVSDPLTEMRRKGAHELLQTVVEAELEAFLAQCAYHRTPEGRVGVVRNGHHLERAVQTGIGPVTVRVPKVRSKTVSVRRRSPGFQFDVLKFQGSRSLMRIFG
jgi:transposase-like protein